MVGISETDWMVALWEGGGVWSLSLRVCSTRERLDMNGEATSLGDAGSMLSVMGEMDDGLIPVDPEGSGALSSSFPSRMRDSRSREVFRVRDRACLIRGPSELIKTKDGRAVGSVSVIFFAVWISA